MNCFTVTAWFARCKIRLMGHLSYNRGIIVCWWSGAHLVPGNRQVSWPRRVGGYHRCPITQYLGDKALISRKSHRNDEARHSSDHDNLTSIYWNITYIQRNHKINRNIPNVRCQIAGKFNALYCYADWTPHTRENILSIANKNPSISKQLYHANN